MLHAILKAAVLQVNHCVEGNAWHADHIRPVYKGGGLCDLDNLRTLCLPCHAARPCQLLAQIWAARRAWQVECIPSRPLTSGAVLCAYSIQSN